jgi:hypothetical protein
MRKEEKYQRKTFHNQRKYKKVKFFEKKKVKRKLKQIENEISLENKQEKLDQLKS